MTPAQADRPTNPAPRRRGRPTGSRTRVLRSGDALGVHHFAFLRACLQGLPARAAWDRYLAFAEASNDARHIEHRRSELMTRVLRDGQQLRLAQPADQDISDALATLGRSAGAAAVRATVLPTLAEFVAEQGLDVDLYSEAELIQEYQAHFGLASAGVEPPAPATTPAEPQLRAQLRALNQLERWLSRAPQPADRIELWFAPSTLPRLKLAGISSLGALCDHLDVHGRRWWRRLPGLGAVRAAALQAWLAPLAQTWGRPLRTLPAAPRRHSALPTAAMASATAEGAAKAATTERRFALRPLPELAVPAHLAGGATAPGRLATSGQNRWGAVDDLSALQAWLQQHPGSAATRRAYAKESERFYLWCVLVRGLPLSSVAAPDVSAYLHFLAQPPADWVQPERVSRDDPAWRPLRGPLSPASRRCALVAVQALMDGLCQAGYLVANPVAPARRHAALPAPGLDTGRAFNTTEWQFVLARLQQRTQAAGSQPAALAGQASAASAQARRLHWVLQLLAASGLRLSELAALDTGHIRWVRPASAAPENPHLPAAAIADTVAAAAPMAVGELTVRGRRARTRQLVLPAGLKPLLQAHLDDAAALGPLPDPAPLVCSLRLVVAPVAGADPGQRAVPGSDTGLAVAGVGGPAATLASSHPVGLPNRRLGSGGLYRLLKRYFQAIALHAHAVDGLSATRLRAASTHWLRHGFGHEAVAQGWDLRRLQVALGHASAATTSVYLAEGDRTGLGLDSPTP